MTPIIIKYFKNFILFINNNLHDLLILSGVILFIGTMFKFVSAFVGCISLSVVLISLGIILAKLRS